MQFRTIAAAFFLEPSAREELVGLATRAGLSGVAALDEQARIALGFHDPARRVLAGEWGVFRETWAVADEAAGLRCLQLYAPAARYLDAVRATREQGGGDGGPVLGYVGTFRDACQSLRPRAAFLDTRPHEEDERWVNGQGSRAVVLAQAPLVAAGDADALAGQFFSLLYLDAALAARWTPAPPWYDREVMELPTGRLIFPGSGPARLA
jgi:hypothetical protein